MRRRAALALPLLVACLPWIMTAGIALSRPPDDAMEGTLLFIAAAGFFSFVVTGPLTGATLAATGVGTTHLRRYALAFAILGAPVVAFEGTALGVSAVSIPFVYAFSLERGPLLLAASLALSIGWYAIVLIASYRAARLNPRVALVANAALLLLSLVLLLACIAPAVRGAAT